MKVIAVSSLVNSLCFIALLALFSAGCKDNLFSKNQALQEERDALEKEVKFLRTENGRLRELNGEPLQIGFEIQIAAFKNFDLAAYSDELVRFQEKKEFEYNKYVLAQFISYEDANLFLKDIHRMGLNKAFIAGVVDGKRTSVRLAQDAAANYYGSGGESISDWDEP